MSILNIIGAMIVGTILLLPFVAVAIAENVKVAIQAAAFTALVAGLICAGAYLLCLPS